MDIEPGTVVAQRYRIQRQLGRGGMGEVFAAENVRTGRIVAVKLLRADSKQKSSAVARFRREARAAGAIHSDFVTQVLDVEEDSEHGIVIVFELLEGESLIDRLKRTGPMSFDELFPVVEQVWIGLADAHKAGVIHRDLKPSNVFLERRPDGSYRVKILDFGISKLPREVGGETLTEMGQSLGTFSFMPPEQIGKAKMVDHRADVYACATLIYQAMSGQLPYAARNILMMVELKAKADPRPLSEVMENGVDPRLEDFLSKCLKRDPNDRYQTAHDALDAWRSLRAGTPSSPGARPQMTLQGQGPMPSQQMQQPMQQQMSPQQMSSHAMHQQMHAQQMPAPPISRPHQQTGHPPMSSPQNPQQPSTLAMRPTPGPGFSSPQSSQPGGNQGHPSSQSQSGFAAVNPSSSGVHPHPSTRPLSGLPSVAETTSDAGSDNIATIAIPMRRVNEALAARGVAVTPQPLSQQRGDIPRMHDDRPHLGTQLMPQGMVMASQAAQANAQNRTEASGLQLPPNRRISGTMAMPQSMAAPITGSPGSGSPGSGPRTIPSQQQPYQAQPQSRPHPTNPARQSYDQGHGELATAIYRRDGSASTSHAGVPLPQQQGQHPQQAPQKKSAIPFVIGMLLLAAVGFSLVAIIISYVQTGHLPLR